MAFLYPWGNTQQLNLDWILQKIKELEAEGGAALDEVANALIAASYSHQAYDRSDIVFRDGKLYRANQAIPAPGEAWTPAHWDEILLGDTVSNLVQYVAALSNDQIANNSNVSGAHTSDALNNLNTYIKNYLFLGSGADAPVIDTGTDYNNLTTIGAYRVLTKADAATMTNTPTTKQAHRLIVMCLINTASIVQVFICNYDTNPAIFTRIKSTDGIWSPWRLLSPIRNTVITVSAGTGTQSFTWNICSPDVLVSNVSYSNPAAVGSNVTFTTGDGTITISGTFYEATDIQFDVQ